jgi:Domain of unknown function (DUF4349)
MPLLDQDPIDPEIAATLDAIDATLAGEPVDGRYAEIAEIALLLASDRPDVRPAFAQSLDAKVERRFAPLGAPDKRRKRNWSRAWQAVGAVAAAGVAVVAAVAFVGTGGGSSGASSSSVSESVTSAASSAASSPPASSAPAPAQRAAKSLSSAGAAASSSGSAASGTASTPSGTASTQSGSVAHAAPQALQPPTSGRKVVQGAQLNLTAAANRIDAVAQEIYSVVGQANGIVENSNVTQGGPGGNASFQLSLPSGTLGQTLTQLSSLTYAQVVSRTDSSQDITDQYGAATRALADARALRTSLLKQLANAVTTEQVDSLTAQIHDAEASISSDQATVNGLNHKVNYSEVYVSLQAQPVPAPAGHHGGGGFTIGKAAHDAGRVLTVVAGVALIALAALTPVALVVALIWWVGAALRRRRREQALDSV